MLIPPGRDAQLAPRPSAVLEERHRNIHSIRDLGRREWHRRSGYSKRSMVENTMYRYKTIIGRSMKSRTFHRQRIEVQLASKILNTMTLLGMPDSYRIAESPLGDGGSVLISESCTSASKRKNRTLPCLGRFPSCDPWRGRSRNLDSQDGCDHQVGPRPIAQFGRNLKLGPVSFQGGRSDLGLQ